MSDAPGGLQAARQPADQKGFKRARMIRRSPGRFILGSLPLLASACSAAPSQDILGSFFPSWMLCGVIGILAAVLLRQALVFAGIDQHVFLPLLTYVAVGGAVTMLVWLGGCGH